MVKIRLITLFLLTCITPSLFSQTEKDILSGYKNALGKSTDEKAIQTMEITGDFVVQKLAVPITIYFKYKNFLRMEMKFQNLTFLQVSNDTLKWDYNPMTDEHKITPVEKKADGHGSDNKTFDYVNNDLLNYKELKHSLKFIRKQKLDSLEVYVLELTRAKPAKSKSKFYISTATSLIYKTEDENGYRYFADYINHDGFVFPRFIIDSSPEQHIEGKFRTLVINKELQDSLFIIPEEILKKNVKPFPANDGLLSVADSLKRAGKLQEADDLYTKFIKSNPDHQVAYNSRGLLRIELKKYYEAIADFNRAIEINPSSPVFRNNLGLAKFYLGDKENAVKDYSTAIELDPAFVTALKNRGLAYIQLSHFDKAADDFREAIKHKPADGEAHFKYGVALAQLDKFKDAISEYEMAFKHQFITAEVYNYKGVSLYRLEQYDSAGNSFRKAAKLDPDNLQYVENYGRALYEVQNYAAAAEQFETYLKKDNTQAEIHNLNGLCKYGEENYKGAIRDFSRSIELNGTISNYYDNRAAAKEMLEDYVGAVKDYSESIRIYPNDPHIFYKRGIIKIQTSQKIEGCLDLATANEMKYEPAKEAIIKNCN